jgi:hypothetical protein
LSLSVGIVLGEPQTRVQGQVAGLLACSADSHPDALPLPLSRAPGQGQLKSHEVCPFLSFAKLDSLRRQCVRLAHIQAQSFGRDFFENCVF